MIDVHPQFIKDAKGEKSLVVLSVDEFECIMEELDELEDIRLYDEAVKNDTGERITAEEVFRMLEAKHSL